LKYLEKCFAKDLLTPDQVDYHKIRRLLVIRSHDQLGDFLLSTPALRALRSRFPNAEIGILTRDYCADAAIHNPYIDHILIHYETGYQWTWKRIRTLWKQLYKKWDMAVVLSSESHSLTSDIWATLSGAKYILGSERFIFPGCSRNFFYNLIAPDGGTGKHQTERNMEIVQFVGANTRNFKEIVKVTESERTDIRKTFQEVYKTDSRLVLGLHIGANKQENRWPVVRFCELAGHLYKKYNARIVVFWGPKEYDLSELFFGQITFNSFRFKPSTLRKQAVHFSLCDIVVCNDTGIMHLCAAVGTPLVAIFGPTDPTTWKPIGKNFIAVRGKNNITKNVSISEVLQEINNLKLDLKK
jgi:ADP-heptose:LPS heptosyltransferase